MGCAYSSLRCLLCLSMSQTITQTAMAITAMPLTTPPTMAPVVETAPPDTPEPPEEDDSDAAPAAEDAVDDRVFNTRAVLVITIEVIAIEPVVVSRYWAFHCPNMLCQHL